MVRYRQESWVDWNRDEAMQNLQSSSQAKALNANICSKTTKKSGNVVRIQNNA